MDTAEKLIEHAISHFKIEDSKIVPSDDIFESLGIDSVQVLELLSELEMVFEVEIPDYVLREIKTYEQLAKEIDRRI